jgi:nitrogen fixation NifU-like protein
VGEIENPDGIGHVGNPVCGDIMELYIKVNDSTIVDAKFKTFGCGAAIATSSMVTEMVKGKSIGEALEISNRAVAEALGGLPPIKMHCSALAEEALKSAIEDYLAKNKWRYNGSK